MGGGFVYFQVRSLLCVMAADVANNANGRPDEGDCAKNKDSEKITHSRSFTAAELV
jgi:hypothetical protein